MIRIQFAPKGMSLNTVNGRLPSYAPPWILILICLMTGFQLFKGYDGDFRPQGIHFWAQADRSSVALHYYDNGLNFFKPQTYYLENSNGLTGIEFPAVQYLTAVVARLFGSRDHIFLIYRLLSFIILVTGLLFFQRTLRMHGGSGLIQILLPFFVLLSPVLLFYGFNLIPDTSSFALILISHYYFERFRLKLSFQAIYPAMAWGFGAALIKLTSAVFPVAYWIWFLFTSLVVNKEITFRQIRAVTLGFLLFAVLCLGINYYFTVYANSKYQSGVFLSTSRHINRWTDFSDIWENVVCWHKEYFRETQYWILLAGFLVSFSVKSDQRAYLWFKGILLLGFSCFVLLMGKQLMHHDYYAICTILPVAILLCLDGLMILASGCLGSLILLYLTVQLYPLSIKQAQQRQQEVYNLPCREIWDYRGYMMEGAQWVKQNRIPKSTVFFVFYDFPLNTPLVYLDRGGMVFNHFKMKDRNLIDEWLHKLNPEYVLIPAQWEAELGKDRPDLLPNLRVVFRGQSVLIYRLTQPAINKLSPPSA